MGIEIRQHTPGKDVRDFIRAGHEVYRFDPAWVPPLDFEIKERLSPKHNPFFKRGEVMLFTAWKNGQLVGRCSATVDREHLRLWKDDTGFFGFLDTIDDKEVAQALLDAAEKWLREKGMKHVIGPLSLYANEEIGILVEGFEYPPMLMMGHSRPYQGGLIEQCGYAKEKDLLCWRYTNEMKFNDRTLKAWESVKALPEVKLRSIDMSRLKQELSDVMDIYNDAWDGKWCFVPALPDEVDKMVKDMKLVLDPDLAFIAEVNGKSMGMCIMLPNLNEVIQDMGGKLLPLNWARLLWRTKVRHPATSRLMLLGIKKELRQNMKRYGGVSAAMYVEVAKRGIAKGYKWAEMSWTREDDSPINLGIRSMGAKPYKKYRVYRKSLAASAVAAAE
jgi:hypothetical protein